MNVSLPKPLIASVVGLAIDASFLGANAVYSWVTVPALLLSSSSSAASTRQDDGSGRITSSKSSDHNTPETSPEFLSRQWKLIYERGKAAAPPLLISASSSMIYAALHLPESAVLARRLHYVATVLSIGIIPFTIIVMGATNTELSRRAAQAETETSGSPSENRNKDQKGSTGNPQEGYYATASTHHLVLRWNMLNEVRCAFGAIATGCMLAAIIFTA